MRIERVLRSVVWLAAAAGIFMVFGWPFAVSNDPADPILKALAISTVVVLLAAIAGAAALRASRHRRA